MKNILITGGTRGIGKAIVERFAREEGYKIIFIYQSDAHSASLLEQGYANVMGYQCDISDYEDTQKVLEQIADSHGDIDILINNAGITNDKTFVNMEKYAWNNVIDVNLKSLYNTTHFVIKDMINNKYGRIINMASVVAQQGAFGQTNYSAAKAGVIGFTKSLALEVATKGITVNAIAPGMIETDMVRAIPDNYLTQIKEKIPMKRLGSTDEVAELVYYLCSDIASYITGQVLNINGGLYL
ncbi:MAG TPA: beta-ketoacyl-ACP reductase [Epulopiscium sp.]|nr:beta-ketoacyl-ACP reductase [Candidatus Epulonipiscium sp.]